MTNAKRYLSERQIHLRLFLIGYTSPPWGGKIHGLEYRVVFSRNGEILQFPFWDSRANMTADKWPTTDSILGTIALDANCPATFREFRQEYGETSTRDTFARCREFARGIRRFFTPDELTELAEFN
jgi:hypothetical protein